MTLSKLEKLVETYGLEWEDFKDSLDEIDKQAFDDLIERAKRHAKAGIKIATPNMFESVVMSILVEHQKELQLLQRRLLQPQTKTSALGAGKQPPLRSSSKATLLVRV